jgi:hypothetical protein
VLRCNGKREERTRASFCYNLEPCLSVVLHRPTRRSYNRHIRPAHERVTSTHSIFENDVALHNGESYVAHSPVSIVTE